MKTQYLIFAFLLFFSTSCGGQGATTSGKASDLIGVYEGVFKGTAFEVWIEEVEQNPASNEHFLSLFVFRKDNFSSIQQFLTRYHDVQTYSDSICNYVKENPNQFYGYDLKTSPSLFYDISADQLWIWDNSLGALGHFIVSPGHSGSSLNIRPHYYINLYPNDEYGLQTLYTNSKGEAIKIKFFETGFIKKPWNYVPLFGPSLKIHKTSPTTKDLWAQYNNVTRETRELFTQAGRENRSYCEIKN